jgi:hypothetical protein
MEISLQAPAESRLVLHWGVRVQNSKGWGVPPQTAWPPGSVPVGKTAVQTPFAKADGQANLVIRLNPTADYTALSWDFLPDDEPWDNNAGTTANPPG